MRISDWSSDVCSSDLYASGDGATRSKTIAARFDALFPEAREPAALHALPNHDLRLLWRAASQAASSAARPDAAETALSIFEACERRGIVDRQDAFEMRGILLAGRRFEQARRFTASHPDAGLSALPAFEDPLASDAQATVWRMNAEGNRLTRTAIDLEPTQILVTAGCHFSVEIGRAHV